MECAVFDLPADVHTHRIGNADAIYNAPTAEALRLCALRGNRQPYSLSLHPWDLRQDAAERVEGLQEFLDAVPVCTRDPLMTAFGECGLDPRCPLPIGTQQAVFETVLDAARHYNRPVIVHCVRLWDAMMQSVTRVWGSRQATEAWENGCPILIHGFRKGPQLARQLVARGYWISFGERFRPETLNAVPAAVRFVETDESSLSIEDIKALQDKCISPT